MKAETIKAQITRLNIALAAFALSKQVEGQTRREREATEYMDKARVTLLEELQGREAQKPALS